MKFTPSETSGNNNHDYNCPDDGNTPNGTRPGTLDVIIPANQPELGPAAARAFLHLLVEVHRKRNAANEHLPEEL